LFMNFSHISVYYCGAL